MLIKHSKTESSGSFESSSVSEASTTTSNIDDPDSPQLKRCHSELADGDQGKATEAMARLEEVTLHIVHPPSTLDLRSTTRLQEQPTHDNGDGDISSATSGSDLSGTSISLSLSPVSTTSPASPNSPIMTTLGSPLATGTSTASTHTHTPHKPKVPPKPKSPHIQDMIIKRRKVRGYHMAWVGDCL